MPKSRVKVRRTWGKVKPVTRVFRDRRRRVKHRTKWGQEE